MCGNVKIAVIVPVYNTEKYVEASVRSIMNQTYRNIEIICVNDGSTDGSLKVLERLAAEDARISVFTKENGGLGDTRNYGMDRASAEWVIFVDSDDTLREDAVAGIADAIEKEDPDMVHYGIQVVTEDGSQPASRDTRYYEIHNEGLVEINDYIILKSDVSAANKAFRRSVISRYGMRFPRNLYEDFEFSIQYMSVIDRVFYIKDKYYMYLRRTGSIMASTFAGTPLAIDHLYAYDHVVEFMNRNDILEKHRRMMVKLFNACYLFSIRYTVPEMIPQIVDYATGIYDRNPFLNHKLVRVVENGTVLFRVKQKKTSRILQKLFSVRYEYIDYKLFKVARVFGVMVYKEARR